MAHNLLTGTVVALCPLKRFAYLFGQPLAMAIVFMFSCSDIPIGIVLKVVLLFIEILGRDPWMDPPRASGFFFGPDLAHSLHFFTPSSLREV